VPEFPDPTLSAYRVGSAVARSLPAGLATLASRAAGAGAAGTMRERRAMVERNLRRVYGPGYGGLALRRSVQRTFDFYARYWVESFRLPGMSAAQLDDGMSYEGFEHIDAAIARGIGPILALPHLGGWEWAAFWLARVQKRPIAAVVEPLEPPDLFEWFAEFRESLGMRVIPLGPGAGTEVVKAIKNVEVVCLLSDRDIEGTGVEVEFFGERTTLPAGPATLALRTGAPILPTAVFYRGRIHHGVIRAPIPAERRGRLRDDVTRVTQLLAHELEVLIRAEPEQWHLMQPNWPSDRA
jgi:KDO2-lipid IV(A) lauroyltransferase